MATGPSPKTIVELLLERGMRATSEGRPSDAMRAYTDVLSHEGATPRQCAIAVFNRGTIRARVEDALGAFEDWSWLILQKEVPSWLLCRAYLSRGIHRVEMQDYAGAVCDYSEALRYAEEMGTRQEAAVDCQVYISQNFSPLALQGKAKANRSAARIELGDTEGALDDARAVTLMEGVSTTSVASAFASLSVCLLILGEFGESQAMARKCLKLSADNGAVRCVIGMGLLAQAQTLAAKDEFLAGLVWIKKETTVDAIVHLLAKIENAWGPLPAWTEFLEGLMNKRNALVDKKAKSDAAKLRRLNLAR